MYDLRVGPVDAPKIAIEVTGAIDAPWMATWNASQKLSGKVPGVDGDWTFVLRPGAHVKRLIPELPAVVEAIGDTGLDTVHEDDLYFRPELLARFDGLGIDSVYRHREPGNGNVYFTLDGDSGAVDSFGETVPGWVGAFVADPDRADNLRKLAATTAPQREAFIIADLVGAPWGVMSYLTDIAGRGVPLPSAPPELPEPLTGVWLVSTFAFRDDARGVRWDGTRWSSFRRSGGGIDDG